MLLGTRVCLPNGISFQTTALAHWCILSFTGLMFQIVSSTSSMYSCTDATASTSKLLGTWWTTVHQFLTLFSASIWVLPAVTNCLYYATRSACMAVGHFLLLARLSGTHCRTTCGIRSVLLTVTDSRCRRFNFCSTSVFSASEFFYVNVLYKFTFDIWQCMSVMDTMQQVAW